MRPPTRRLWENLFAPGPVGGRESGFARRETFIKFDASLLKATGILVIEFWILYSAFHNFESKIQIMHAPRLSVSVAIDSLSLERI